MSLLSKIFRSSPPPDQTIEILNRHLTGDFRVSPMAEKRSTIATVQAVAKRLGVTFPPELVAHLTGEFPGIFIEAKEEVWPRPKLYDVGPFWSFLYAVHTYTAASDSSNWMRIEFAANEFQQNTGLDAVPVLAIKGDANIYCLNPESKLVRFDHELNTLEPIEMGFFQLFEQEVTALRQRVDQKNSEGKP